MHVRVKTGYIRARAIDNRIRHTTHTIVRIRDGVYEYLSLDFDADGVHTR